MVVLRGRTTLAPAKRGLYWFTSVEPKQQCYQYASRRCVSSATTKTLPLHGYRVLDMTRVLAGVRIPTFAPVSLGLFIVTRHLIRLSRTAPRF